MATREFFSSACFLLGLMVVLSAMELCIPLFARGERSSGRGIANLGLTILTFVLNWVLISVAAMTAVLISVRGRGLLAPLGLSLPTTNAISIIALDLSTYLAHLSMHKVPLLWRFHRVHHSDPFTDATTTFRQHPMEGIWRFVWIIVPVWLLGLPASGVVAYRIISAGNGMVEHANIRLWQPLDSALSVLWSTPNMHKIHHSCVSEQTNSNYGNLLALFDRGFRTFTPTREALTVTYGLEGSDWKLEKSFVHLLAIPFVRSRHKQS